MSNSLSVFSHFSVYSVLKCLPAGNNAKSINTEDTEKCENAQKPRPRSQQCDETFGWKTIGASELVEVDSNFIAADPVIPRGVPPDFCAKTRVREAHGDPCHRRHGVHRQRN